MKNFNKTLIFTVFLSVFSIIGAILIQFRGQNNVEKGCSYLDPFLIDILAFLVGFFFIIEGVYRIIENKDAPLKKQITRSFRIAFGSGILSLHILQFIHK